VDRIFEKIKDGENILISEKKFLLLLNPAILAETEQFLIKFAENPAEIEEAQRLRFRIFNIEQGKGLNSSLNSGIDSDEFDEHCIHLLVIDKAAGGSVVGTYRMHLGSVASLAKGFYSEREYDIEGLDSISDLSLELGRSCVSPDYRTGAVMALLWGGIAELMRRAQLRYMLGCVSLEETSADIGWALYNHFVLEKKISGLLRAKPKTHYILPKATEKEISQILKNPKELLKHIPPLFKGYLRVGCEICGEPALDREFGTIDFLIIVDKESVPERYKRHFKPLTKSA
jgi:putative hemolysin